MTINGVVPGRIATPRVESLDQARAASTGTLVEDVRRQSKAAIPASRYGDPGELAAAVAYLASEQGAYQTGTLVRVDGGLVRSLLTEIDT